MSLHFVGFPTNARRRTYQILVQKLFTTTTTITLFTLINYKKENIYNLYCTLINLVEQISVKKDLDEGKDICFDLLKNSQGNTINSRQKITARKKVNTRLLKENEFTPEQRKTRPQKKKNGKFIGSRFCKLF